MGAWIRTEHRLPPEGQLVLTRSPDGMEQELKRQGRLWFSGSMYVYYTPEAWFDEEATPSYTGSGRSLDL